MLLAGTLLIAWNGPPHPPVGALYFVAQLVAHLVPLQPDGGVGRLGGHQARRGGRRHARERVQGDEPVAVVGQNGLLRSGGDERAHQRRARPAVADCIGMAEAEAVAELVAGHRVQIDRAGDGGGGPERPGVVEQGVRVDPHPPGHDARVHAQDPGAEAVQVAPGGIMVAVEVVGGRPGGRPRDPR